MVRKSDIYREGIKDERKANRHREAWSRKEREMEEEEEGKVLMPMQVIASSHDSLVRACGLCSKGALVVELPIPTEHVSPPLLRPCSASLYINKLSIPATAEM